MSAFISSRTGAPLRRRAMVMAGLAAAVFTTTATAHAAEAQPRSRAAASSAPHL
ncbi:hypothetical protein ABIE67_005178 [Streptomyces sp. V4I8]|uniref:hypothetical protein n=1 Tax=Streptomyces sp. V4I8 TaxID=3156469 RepID=UPI003516F422